MKQKKMVSAFFGGILPENLVFRLALAACATLAVTANAMNGLGLGLATALALICSNKIIALVRGALSEHVRPFAYALIIGAFVSVVQMLLAAFLPDLSATLGIYIPLMAISCMLLTRVYGADEKPHMISAGVDGLMTGLLFTLMLLVLSAVRELLGYGTLFGTAVFGEGFEPMLILKAVPGGFVLLGVLYGIVNYFIRKGKTSEETQEGGAKA